MTGALPVRAKNQNRSSRTSRLTRSQAITSTGRLRQAGAKKCVTVARSGFRMWAKSRPAGMELVLEVMIASGETMSSIAAKILCFNGMLSVAASITKLHSLIRP